MTQEVMRKKSLIQYGNGTMPHGLCLHVLLYLVQKHVAHKMGKYSAIRNCWLSARGAIKLHPFGTSVKLGMRAEGQRGAILLPFQQLYY